MIQSKLELINRNIFSMRPGQQCGLKEMFGDNWNDVGTPGERKKFGSLFRQALDSGVITGLKWVRIEKNGRFDVYEKL